MGSLAPKTTHPQPAWATVLAQGVDEAKERRRKKPRKPVQYTRGMKGA